MNVRDFAGKSILRNLFHLGQEEFAVSNSM